MFLPQAMTEIELVVPEKDVLAVTELLAEQGVFHPVDVSHLSLEAESGSEDNWQQRFAAYSALERRVLALMKTLNVEEGQPSPELAKLQLIDIDLVSLTIDHIEQEIQEITRDLEQGQKRLEQLQRYIYQLEPLMHLDIDISALRSLRYLVALLGIMPADNVERLRTSLIHIPYVLLILREENRQAVVLLVGARRDAGILERAARSAYLNPLKLPDDYRGTPDQIIAAVRAGIKRMEQHIADQKVEIERRHNTLGRQLRALLWRLRISRMVAEAVVRYGKRHYTYLIVGWVPTDRVENLSQQLHQVSSAIFIEARTPVRHNENQNVPTSLNNPPFLRPFQQLVTNYGYPRYAEIDPTPLMALTYPLIFGIMFGDVGHGAVMTLLGGLLISRRVKVLRGLGDLGPLIFLCGLVATLFGFLYGSVFGLEHILPALWLRPLRNISDILLVTVITGTALLNIGFLCYLANAWLARDWGHFISGRNGIAGIVLYWALVGFVVKTFAPNLPIPLSSTIFGLLAGIAGIAIVFEGVLSNWIAGRRPLLESGFGTYLVQAFFELFETLLGFLSNTLSYVRMGAFAVAHGGLSAVVFILAEMVSPSHGIGYWLVAALGNLVIIGFEGLIVGIQTLRLEYYEFFSKFFTGGGASYTPLKLLSQAKE